MTDASQPRGVNSPEVLLALVDSMSDATQPRTKLSGKASSFLPPWKKPPAEPSRRFVEGRRYDDEEITIDLGGMSLTEYLAQPAEKVPLVSRDPTQEEPRYGVPLPTLEAAAEAGWKVGFEVDDDDELRLGGAGADAKTASSEEEMWARGRRCAQLSQRPVRAKKKWGREHEP